jgi:hypothetical protein
MTLSSVRTEVCNWRGANARVWAYTASHSVLTIRLQLPDHRGNLHLVCSDCEYFSGPLIWTECDLEIEERDDEVRRLRLIVRDRRAKIEVDCGLLAAKPNVDPVY